MSEAPIAVPEAGTLWRHYKGGLYVVVTHAQRERDGGLEVVYRSWGDGKTFCRPLAEWQETVLKPDGTASLRFAFTGQRAFK